LANVLEHAAILCEQLPLGADDLPDHFLSRRLRSEVKSLGPISLRDLEMKAIHDALERNDGNKPLAAEELGISLKTLYNKLNQSSALEKSA
jgi:two-component system NtrC family response regulator